MEAQIMSALENGPRSLLDLQLLFAGNDFAQSHSLLEALRRMQREGTVSFDLTGQTMVEKNQLS